MGGGEEGGQLPGRYLDCHMYLLLVRCQVVALSKKDLPEGSLSQLPLQDDVVPLDVLDDCREPEPDTDTVTVRTKTFGLQLQSEEHWTVVVDRGNSRISGYSIRSR